MQGLYILIVTPMDDKMRVDYEGHRENVRKLIELGVDGIILNGTVGEFHTCSDEERERLTRILVEEGKGKVMCIAGCSAVNTAEAIRRTRRAAELGADGVMNVVPYYGPPSKEEAVQYWRDLAEACPDIGLVCYNNPHTTQVLMTDEDFAAMEGIPNFVGSKMLGGDVWLYLNCMRHTTQKHFPLEQLWGISKVLGGSGVMASFIYACPQYMMNWWRTICRGSVGEAIQMQHEVNELLQEVVYPPIKSGYSEIAATKAFVEALGHWHCGKSRKPFFPMPQEKIDEMRHRMEEQFPQFLE
jgi:dihydrodipicolinate synthase/N-acetylneuraminate lyase